TEPEVLVGVPAVELFMERARAADPAIALTPSNGRSLAEICRTLDGLPLALELAAPWGRAFPPDALLVQLRRRPPSPPVGGTRGPTARGSACSRRPARSAARCWTRAARRRRPRAPTPPTSGPWSAG